MDNEKPHHKDIAIEQNNRYHRDHQRRKDSTSRERENENRMGNRFPTLGSASPPIKVLTFPLPSVTTRILELLLSAINRTGSPFTRPLQIPCGAAKPADIGSASSRCSSVPLPIIAEQEFFSSVLVFFSIRLVGEMNESLHTYYSTIEFLRKHKPRFDGDQPWQSRGQFYDRLNEEFFDR